MEGCCTVKALTLRESRNLRTHVDAGRGINVYENPLKAT